MCQLQAYLGRLLLAAALTAIAGAVRHASAQERDTERDQPVGLVSSEQRLESVRTQVDQAMVSRLGVQEIKTRDLLEMLLFRRLGHLAAKRHFTEAQSSKLKLAGRADIKHFMDRLDEIARNIAESSNDRNELRRFVREIQEAASDVRAGFFTKDSLFYKTLARLPGPEPEKTKASNNKNQTVESQSTSGWDSLDVEEDRSRAEVMRLTSTIAFCQDFSRWLTVTSNRGDERRANLER